MFDLAVKREITKVTLSEYVFGTFRNREGKALRMLRTLAEVQACLKCSLGNIGS
jgi:hypothetical protein